jgi:flagellar biosynthesis GTPase FlhF
MKQARRLAPNAKSDTTRTDYFRLKALGIDPDTPVVPLTKKRTRNEVEVNRVSKAIKSSPQAPPSSHTNKTSTTQTSIQESSTPSKSADDADEALFASLRSVREALAESEQWMQSERQSIERQSTERATTPQTNASSPDNETPAQRKLREIKERGHTPSRTEIRLRAMGDKAILPKGFWDGEGMGKNLYGKGKHKDVDAMTPTPLPGPSFQLNQQMSPSRMGFAALGAQGHINGQFGHQRQMYNQFGMNGQLGMQNMSGVGRDESEQKTGASVEDAIEL